jgi:hypothetical protein
VSGRISGVSQASTFRARRHVDLRRQASAPEVFVDTVVPILRERGLVRTAYTGRMLREHFGLPRPENRFATRTAAAAG